MRAARTKTIPPSTQSELLRSHNKTGLADKAKPSPGLKNHWLTMKSSSGKNQKTMLVAKMPNRKARARRSDFAVDEEEGV